MTPQTVPTHPHARSGSRPCARVLLSLALSLLATGAAAAPSTPELDPGVIEADRCLRAAEMRPTDETALALYRRASEQAEAALARNPQSPGANFIYFAATGRLLLADGLAKNLFTLRSLDKKYLDRAIQLDPEYANALAAKGGVLLDLPTLIGGDPAEGLRLLKKASRLNPGGVGTRVSLAKALARNGDVDDARREARRAAHQACIQGRRKALDEATALLDELDNSVASAGLR